MGIQSNFGNQCKKCYFEFKFRVSKFMKLCKSFLITQALLGLLAPITAAASEINLDEMNIYARKNSSFKKRFNSKTFSNKELFKSIIPESESISKSEVDEKVPFELPFITGIAKF